MAKVPYISQEQQEEFEHFLLDQMDEAAKINFGNKLDANPDLKAQFLEFKFLSQTIEEEGLRNSLDDFHQQFTPDQEKSTTGQKRQVYLIAASIAAFVALGLTLFLNRSTQGEKLFDAHFNPDPGLPTVMGSNDNYAFYEAMVDYKQENYTVAIGKWEKLLVNKSKNDTLNYFLGVAHLADNQEEKAKKYLQSTFGQKESSFFDASGFYLGLSYLKNGDMEKAITTLKSSNDERSKKLLKRIEKWVAQNLFPITF